MQQSAWVGWVNFAGLMLILLGCFHAIQGLVALFRDEVFVVGQPRPGRGRRLHRVGLGAHCLGRGLAIVVGSSLLAGRRGPGSSPRSWRS